jgi:transcriptional regulator with XRE-family HTH domain
MPQRPVFHSELGAYFTRLRQERGWTQRQTAAIARQKNMSAIGRQTVWRLETGKVKNPDEDVLRAIATLYGVTYEDLVARCVEAQYGIEMRPAKPGAPRLEAVVAAAFDPEEQRVLKAFRRVKSAKQRHAIIITVEAMASPDSKRRTKEPPQQ